MFAFAAAGALMTGCAREKPLDVKGAWVRLSAVAGRPAAAYFTAQGGAADATLTGVSTNIAIKAEMHETKMMPGGGMTMDPVVSVPVPAQGAALFAPGGKHVMLFDVNPKITPGSAAKFTFTFADGQKITRDAKVIAAGDPAPK